MPSDVSQSDRASAAGIHVASVFAPLVAPAIGYFVFRRSSRFVAAHSLQALYETLALNLLLLVAGIASLSYTIFRLYGYYQVDWQGFSIWEFLIRFAIGWAALAILGFVNMIVSLRQAAAAWSGKWPKGNLLNRRLIAEAEQPASAG